ncbi:unnamed protein product [Rhizophagus irregularis]|nr:unnamed protein product [Rhizophagus irregularis]CAB5363280.1 unnamed protein product [Rhizophagus irregularis]
MSQNNIQIDKLTCEQRQQFFLALFNNEPSLLNVLNTEQRQKLYTALMTIDPSLKSLNAHSTIYGTTNEQACFKLFLQIFRNCCNCCVVVIHVFVSVSKRISNESNQDSGI